MRWRRALTLLRVVRLGLRAPQRVPASWDRYWSEVRATGDGGDVLWDTSDPAEAARYLALFAGHADPALPVVDVGCGNGRFTRALAPRFPRVLGVDLSPAAIARARRESSPEIGFRTLDMTTPGAGTLLVAELGGPANVFVRGLLHVLDVAARRRLADNVAALTGPRGTVLLAETNRRGPLLRYLESLGAGPHGIPGPLARAIATGIPRPRPFGAAELRDCFPTARWLRLLEDTDATITTIPLRRPGVPDTVPGFVAVLRPAAGSGRAGRRSGP